MTRGRRRRRIARDRVRAWLATLDPASDRGRPSRSTSPNGSSGRTRPGPARAWPSATWSRTSGRRPMADRRGASMSARGAAEVAVGHRPRAGPRRRSSARPAGRGSAAARPGAVLVRRVRRSGAPRAALVVAHRRPPRRDPADASPTAASIGSAPSFLRRQPGRGARAARRPARGRSTGEEALARALLAALTPEQRRVAIVDPVAPPDIRSGTGRGPTCAAIPVGIRHDALDARGSAALGAAGPPLSRPGRGPTSPAAEWERIVDAGLDER